MTLASIPVLRSVPALQNLLSSNTQQSGGLVHLAIVLTLTIVLGWLFHTPSRVATLLLRASPERGKDEVAKTVMSRLAVATLWTVLYLIICIGARAWVSSTSMIVLFDAAMIAFVVVVALDVRRDWLAFRASEDWVPVWLEHRVYAVDIAVRFLEERQIPVLARGQHARTLFQFAAPHLPMELWVPSEHEAEASALLQGLLCPPSEQGKGDLAQVFE